MTTSGGQVRTAASPGPMNSRDRIETLDVLRGFAVLGILAVNARAFSWPGLMDAASDSVPFSMEGENRWALWVVDVFFHNKCRTLFSMLFGVSIFLVGGDGSDAERDRVIRRRLLVLAGFGLVHGLAFWFGDILLLYAWSGLFVMAARGWPAKRLLWIGGALVAGFALMTFIGALPALMAPSPTPDVVAEIVARAKAANLEIVARVRSGWSDALLENLGLWTRLQTASLLVLVLPTAGLMMLGLGLFKSGVLAGLASDAVCSRFLVVGLTITAAYAGVHWISLGPGAPSRWVQIADAALELLAPLVTLAWVGLLILMARRGMGAVIRRLAPVGRLALTNYLTQTLIMTSLFSMPWGPQLFGRVEPAGLWLIVVAVWLMQLIWSPLWLSRFQMGPFEWVWRCLTFGRALPLRAGP